MFANSQSSFTGQASSGNGSSSGATPNRTTPRQGSPTYHHHLGTYGYTQQPNAYSHPQDYGMHPMDPAMAWQAYSGFYRGYDMASATSAFAESVWPHSTHHPFGNVSSAVSAAAVSLGGHHDGVDPLDPLQIASSSSSLIPTENFGSSAVNVHNNSDACNRETDSPEYKPSHFLTNGSSNQQQDHPSGRSGNPTRPSPDSGLTISDGVSSSGSPNQNIQSAHHLNSNVGMLGSPGSSPPPGSDLMNGNRPQPARSPYEWIKRPNFQNRSLSSSKEDLLTGRTRTKDKYRVVYSDHQRLELEKEFHYSRYITIRRKSELAQGLGLSERQVKIWFQNRRAKERKQMKKRDEMIHKEKLDVAAAAAGFHHHHQAAAAAAAAAQAAAAAAFSVPAHQMLQHSHHHSSLSHLQP